MRVGKTSPCMSEVSRRSNAPRTGGKQESGTVTSSLRTQPNEATQVAQDLPFTGKRGRMHFSKMAVLSVVVALTQAGLVTGQTSNSNNGATTLPAVNQLSVSVTQGGSIRALVANSGGGPVLLDRLPGELWTSAPAAQNTFLPANVVAAGLSNAEVQVFAVDQASLVGFSASRTTDAWTRVQIDSRAVRGKPCAAPLGSGAFVFAQGANGELITAQRTESKWVGAPALENAFTGGVTSIVCGTLRTSPATLAVVANSGQGTRVAVVDTTGRIAAATLQDKLGRAVTLSGEAVIASSDSSADILAVTASGTVAHWTQAKGSSSWSFSPEALPVAALTSAAWWQGKLYLMASSGVGQVTLLSKAPGKQWDNVTLGAPAGESFRGAPVLAAQPDRLSALVLLESGKLLSMYTDDGGVWQTEFPPSTTGVRASRNQIQAKLTANAATAPTDNASSLNTFIDGIPLLIPPPAQDPKTVPSGTSMTRLQGISFETDTFNTTRSTNFQNVITTDPNSDLLYPDSVIQGSSVALGTLAGVALPRAPLSITLTDVVGHGPMYVNISTPTLATVATGIRDLLQGANVQNTPARLDYLSAIGNSEDDALMNLGISANFLGQTVKGQVKSSSTQKTNTVAVKFVQSYYTLSAEQPSTPASLFLPTVTAGDAARFLGAHNPPVYISSITYGRMLIYTFESTASASDLQAAVDAAIKVGNAGGTVSLTVQQQQILNNSQVHMFAYGGSATDALELVAGTDFTKTFPTYLRNGANFSFDSPALPLSYTLRFVKDGTIAQINAATQWSTTTTYALPEKHRYSVSLGRNSNGMTRTGILVRTGDLVSISASGTIWSGVWATGTTRQMAGSPGRLQRKELVFRMTTIIRSAFYSK